MMMIKEAYILEIKKPMEHVRSKEDLLIRIFRTRQHRGMLFALQDAKNLEKKITKRNMPNKGYQNRKYERKTVKKKCAWTVSK